MAYQGIPQMLLPQALIKHPHTAPAHTSIALGAIPLSTFPQNHLAIASSGPVATVGPRQVAASWSPPQAPSSDLVGEMRQAVRNTDWQQLYLDKKTKFLMAAGWSADEQRCHLLQTLVAVSGARRVLEIGACCGVATLAMAEVLPVDGEVVSLEIDQFLADFGKQYWARTPHGRKIHSVVGPAMQYLDSPAAKQGGPFDLVVIDADKDGMWSYYIAVKEGLVTPNAPIVLDTTPYKGQPPDRYVRWGASERWESNSGQGAIEDVMTKLRNEKSVMMASFAGVTVLYPRPVNNEPPDEEA